MPQMLRLNTISEQLIRLHGELKNKDITVQEIVNQLIESNVKVILENKLQKNTNAIRSNQFKHYVGLPVWYMVTTVPAGLLCMRLAYTLPHGKTFFNLLKQGMSLAHFDASAWSRIFHAIAINSIANRVATAWNMQFNYEAFKSHFNYSSEQQHYENNLQKVITIASQFDALILLISKTAEGQSQLEQVGLKAIGIQSAQRVPVVELSYTLSRAS